MTNAVKPTRRVGIAVAVLVGVLLLGFGGYVLVARHLYVASDSDCSAAQAVVKSGATLTDETVAKATAYARMDGPCRGISVSYPSPR